MESWETWRCRLVALRRELEAHLDAADNLAREAQALSVVASAMEMCDRDRREMAQPGAVSPEVTRALEYLAAHYERPVGLAELARIAGCSRERLARACRRETGATVRAHLTRLRLARAAREVGDGDKIEAVMLGVGYRGKRNFYRQFKARFGMTPGRYRTEVRRGRR